jgi:tetratricopeptide (TPR) repeat protein
VKNKPRNKNTYSSSKKEKSSRPKAKGSAENARKGKLLEALVALLYDYPGVKVERNVKLPALNDPTRKREIDVLLTGHLAGVPIRIAFQCKNERKKVEPETIGAFANLLEDVGIAPQNGIFVCVNGYTSGALGVANKVGVRPLVMRGLTKNRLASEVTEAFQFNVFLLGEVTKFVLTNSVSTQEYAGQFLIFSDDNERPRGIVPDLIFSRWQQGEPPSKIGEYDLTLDVPQGWNQFFGGKPEPVQALSATVRVTGLIVSLSGKTTHHTLIDPVTQKVDRSRVQAQFEIPQDKKVELPVKAVHTEEELAKFTRRNGGVRVMTRIRLPRIRCGAMFYPPSERVRNMMLERGKGLFSGEVNDIPSFTFEETEGSDLRRVWEGPWTGFFSETLPVIVTDDEGNSVDVHLLMEAEEYGRVVTLRPKFEQHPTTEFARLLSWAYLMQAEILMQKAKGKGEADKKRLVELSIEKIGFAIEISPALSDAFVRLGDAYDELGRKEEAVASYDRATEINKDDYDAWLNKVAPLINLSRLDDALESVNKAHDLASDPEDQVPALMMRAYIHYIAARHSDAASDLVAAWKTDADQVINNTSYQPTIETVCLTSLSPETLFPLVEMYWSEAASLVKRGNKDEAARWAEQASERLDGLKKDTGDPTLITATLSGDVVEEILTRIGSRLMKSEDMEFAKEQIERIQSWVLKMGGERLHSLDDFLSGPEQM